MQVAMIFVHAVCILYIVKSLVWLNTKKSRCASLWQNADVDFKTTVIFTSLNFAKFMIMTLGIPDL